MKPNNTTSRRNLIKNLTVASTVGSVSFVGNAAANSCRSNQKNSTDNPYYLGRDWDTELLADLTSYWCRQWGTGKSTIKAYSDSEAHTYDVDGNDDAAEYIELNSTIEFYGDRVTFDSKYPEYEYTGTSVSYTTSTSNDSSEVHGMNEIDATVKGHDYTELSVLAYIEKDGRSVTYDATATIDRYTE
jgi:hypothetical protein